MIEDYTLWEKEKLIGNKFLIETGIDDYLFPGNPNPGISMGVTAR